MKYIQVILAVLQIYKAVKEKGEDDSVIAVVIAKLAAAIGLNITEDELSTLHTIVKEIIDLRK